MSYVIEDVKKDFIEVSFPPFYSEEEMIENAKQIADEHKMDVVFESQKEHLIKYEV